MGIAGLGANEVKVLILEASSIELFQTSDSLYSRWLVFKNGFF